MSEIRDEILLQKIASKIKALRKDAGISQRELHNITDINIDRIEGAKANVTVGTIKKICTHFNISLAEFFKDFE